MIISLNNICCSTVSSMTPTTTPLTTPPSTPPTTPRGQGIPSPTLPPAPKKTQRER
jgi:hypothetical protein